MDIEKIVTLISPVVEKSGYSLYDVEFIGRTLRVSIDRTEGISLQDCVDLSRLINPLLDVEDAIPGGRYELEVSSPGLDRNLRKPPHFQSVVGHKIHVTTEVPLSNWNGGLEDSFFRNRKNISGILTSFDGVTIALNTDGRDVKIPLSAVAKAYVDFEMKTTPKKGKRVENG